MTMPLTPDTLIYDFTPASDPQVSPDGTRVLYSLSTTDRATKKTVSHLWLTPIDADEPRRLTWAGERNGGARWAPDGASIAFTSDRAKRPGIFVLPVDGAGEARELTRHGQAITDLAWSPDGKRIAYTTQVDPENPSEEEPAAGAAPRVRVTRRIDYKQDNRGYLGDARLQVFVVDVATGERRQVTSEPVDHVHPQWSPDGKALVVAIPNRNGMCSQLGIVDVATGETRRIGPETGVVSCWAWSARGDRIVFAGDERQTWQSDFFVYDLATDQVRRVTEDLQPLPDSGFATIAAPSQPIWLDEDHVLFHGFRAGASGIYRLDLTSGKVDEVASWLALHGAWSVDRAKRFVAQPHASLERTGEIATVDLASGATRITNFSEKILDERPPAYWEPFKVRRGDHAIDAWLLKPSEFDPAKRYPVVLDVHGGPNGHYGFGFNAIQQCLATNGFLVVYANPRGSTSYGRAFTQQVIRDWGGEDYRDLLAVVDAVLERPYADAERLGIFGYSYGGYIVSWAIGQTDRFQAAVCGAPCFDLASMYGESDISHTFSELQWGGAPHEAADWYREHSPSTYAHRARTPTLLLHGEADERCPIGQGEQLFVALKKAGCEVEFVRYPGASHLFLRGGPPEHREDFLQRVLAWFKQHLGEPAPNTGGNGRAG